MMETTESQREAIERLKQTVQEEYDVLYARRAELEKDVARRRAQLADVSDLIAIEERKLADVRAQVARELAQVTEAHTTSVNNAKAHAASCVAACNRDVKQAEDRKEKALLREADAVSRAQKAEDRAKSLEGRLSVAERARLEFKRSVEALG